MALSDRQIERYSRQIIVPHVGGRAQERLLAARVLLAGDAADVEAPAAYLAGAGVGVIGLRVTSDRAQGEVLAARMRGLNPDVTVLAQRAGGPTPCDLVLGFAASPGALDMLRAIAAEDPRRAFVLARLDDPARIGIFPAPPPCPQCAAGALFGRAGRRAEDSALVAILATAEAFKLLAGYAESPAPALVEFNGYESNARRVSADPACACWTTAAGVH
jgi:hypothetical protein